MKCFRVRWYEAGRVSPLVRNEKDGSLMVLVPEGEFEMGDGREGDCPKRRVWVDAFYIGVYSVTNRQYGRFVSAMNYRAPDISHYSFAVWANGKCPEAKMDDPVVCVSWNDAVAYAKWAGCDLPTEAQWEKAARGPQGLVYPWGDEWDEGRCQHMVGKPSGCGCPVYGHPSGASGYGTYQQSGNVWNWCRDRFGKAQAAGSRRNRAGRDCSADRAIRGGSWRVSHASHFRAAHRYMSGPEMLSGVVGLRLVRAAS